MPVRSLLRTAAATAVIAGALPVGAIEQVQIRFPFVDESFNLKVSELADPQALLNGNSDLAELDRATDGVIGRGLLQVFKTPLPISGGVFDQATDSPLVNQSLMVLSSMGALEGLPTKTLTAAQLSAAINKSAVGGQVTLLSLLQALPGDTARVDLARMVFLMNRNARQRQRTEQLVNSLPAASSDAGLSGAGSLAVQRAQLSLPVAHRPQPLQLVLIQPTTQPNGRLVVISHGLWDGPESFEGWANHLASRGYTVVLPLHPGSDKDQQQAMLNGEVPPPSPSELRLRPLDVTAVLDAVQANRVQGHRGQAAATLS